jgi:hypothetical protein
MKQLIFGFAFFNFFLAEACMCSFTPITEHYQNSDFVAIGKILKVYPNESDEEIYEAEIQINELIKGPKISSIFVMGRSDGKMGSSCSIFTPEHTEYIFFGKKDVQGRIVFGACSGTRETERIKKYSPYLFELFDILKNQQEDYSGKPDPGFYLNFHESLEQFKGKPLSEKFALYEVNFKEDLTVEKVKIIKGFGKEVDQVLIQGLSQSGWMILYNRKQFSVPKGSKKLVGIFYYESDEENPSFLSPFDL